MIRGPVAAVWALAVVVSVRLQLRRRPLHDVRVPSARALRDGGDRTVGVVLAATRSRCLVRALVLQEVWSRRGRDLDIVVGVGEPGETFEAHSWLEHADSATLVEVVSAPIGVERFLPVLKLRKKLSGSGYVVLPVAGP